ncbi:hypothetical protein [Mycetocola saprophilus]|uniref:hypothetical protein n=1 Tax=Mycetocola saprophilus TaxID=76636 RepID=UPI003BF08A2C
MVIYANVYFETDTGDVPTNGAEYVDDDEVVDDSGPILFTQIVFFWVLIRPLFLRIMVKPDFVRFHYWYSRRTIQRDKIRFVAMTRHENWLVNAAQGFLPDSAIITLICDPDPNAEPVRSRGRHTRRINRWDERRMTGLYGTRLQMTRAALHLAESLGPHVPVYLADPLQINESIPPTASGRVAVYTWRDLYPRVTRLPPLTISAHEAELLRTRVIELPPEEFRP